MENKPKQVRLTGIKDILLTYLEPIDDGEYIVNYELYPVNLSPLINELFLYALGQSRVELGERNSV
jgi:hypothetical protein